MHAKSIAQVLKNLKSSKNGLTSSEVKRRLKKYGKNKLPRSGHQVTRFKIFLDQWKSPLLVILLIAGVVSGLLGEYVDMTVILITVAVNALVGFVQEDKANRALQKLQQMMEYKALVLRDGRKLYLPSEEIVPGDILFIEAGDRIQADGRILEQIDLEINEAPLTGESEPIKKHTRVLKPDTNLAEQHNMVFRGTSVVNGRGMVLITSTGKNTEIGKIASLVKGIKDDRTPLQNQIAKLGKYIGYIVLGISLLLFILGILSQREEHSFLEMFGTAVAVAVAAIPEGLIISVTVILAIGMQYILKRKALVRRLVSAETLGSVSVICADKTGTLTEGNMRVTRLITKNDDLDFAELKLVHQEEDSRHADALMALRIGVLCNDANMISKENSDGINFLGDTTETALLHAGFQSGFNKDELEKVFRRIDEIPFDSTKKYMVTLHNFDHSPTVYVKGAPEVILARCSYYEENGQKKKMTDKDRQWFEAWQNKLANQGLRVLALAYKEFKEFKNELEESDANDLVLTGLVAMSDPLRPKVKQTLDIAREAGIKIIMITGDHAHTAQSIAEQIGIPHKDKDTFDGARLDKVSDLELQKIVEKVSVFARVDPKHKIRIVRALQANDEVVAMTGDGVNDAPALKGADIGVAVGSGTDVSKEISDVVLLDDHVGTIVSAVEEGRRIYQNIKKVVLYLLSGSFAEIVLIGGSIIAGLPLAVSAVQILWVNLIEDSFPTMALAFDKGDKENMSDPPRKRSESIIDREMKVMILIIGVVSNLILFSLFLYFWKNTQDIALTRTIIFIGLGIDSVLYVYSIRSLRHMIWQMNPFSNKYLTAAVLFGWLMLIGAVYLPPFQVLLRTVALGWQHWVVLVSFGLVNVLLIEIVKWVFIVRRQRV